MRELTEGERKALIYLRDNRPPLADTRERLDGNMPEYFRWLRQHGYAEVRQGKLVPSRKGTAALK